MSLSKEIDKPALFQACCFLKEIQFFPAPICLPSLIDIRNCNHSGGGGGGGGGGEGQIIRSSWQWITAVPIINYEKDRSANLGIFSTVYHLTTPPFP